MSSMRRFAAIYIAVALLLVACTGSTGSSGGASTAPAESMEPAESTGAMEPVTIEWWHIQNNDPGMSLWAEVAQEFMDEHENVTINITVLENETFKTRIVNAMQAGEPPDLFQSWGAGGLQAQVDAGLVTDITDAVSPWIGNLNEAGVGMFQVDDRQYGIPFDLGMVGLWYNKDLFADAGIDAPPATWEELLADVQLLKDAGITPIAVGEGDKWPGAFWWEYLALRFAGGEAMLQATIDGSFDAEPFVRAGEELERLIGMEPFQDGFLATPWEGAGGEAALVANGQAAMHLMGQWAPGTQRANAENGEGLGDALGWFPFPAVEGGAGAPTEAIGGGNGFAVGRDAPAEAVDFLEYITSMDVANRWGETNSGILPVTIGSEASISDEFLQLVLEGRGNATFVQLYLDQATTPDIGNAINDAIQVLFAGQATPEETANAVAEAVRSGG